MEETIKIELTANQVMALRIALSLRKKSHYEVIAHILKTTSPEAKSIIEHIEWRLTEAQRNKDA